MGLLEKIEEKAFLGEEFLTWLLWKSETRNGVIEVEDIEVHFGGNITLSAPFGDAEEVALKGENPAAAAELLSALREGKLISKAQLRWVVEGVEWNVALKGATLAMGGVKPPLKSAPQDAAWIDRRLGLLEEFGAAFDKVFEAFLAIRLSEKTWKAEANAMRDWASKGDSRGGGGEAPDLIEIRDE